MSDQKFEFTRPKNSPVTDDQLIADLKRISNEHGIRKISQSILSKYGRFNATTYITHFGSWNNALLTAGLEISNEVEISDARLFENLLTIWQIVGKQPARADLTNSASIFSQSPYLRRFGSWTNSLKSFIEYMNEKDIDVPTTDGSNDVRSHKTSRDPSLRLRYKILKRDNFSCVVCGASPAKNSKVELHLDHIVAWNRGGETTEENLTTLCSKCNLGKSDLL
jgi:hypothetical protein